MYHHKSQHNCGPTIPFGALRISSSRPPAKTIIITILSSSDLGHCAPHSESHNTIHRLEKCIGDRGGSLGPWFHFSLALSFVAVISYISLLFIYFFFYYFFFSLSRSCLLICYWCCSVLCLRRENGEFLTLL